jgi:hypothetical protein
MRTCQGAAVTGQQCEGTGEEVRRCSEQRCPGKKSLLRVCICAHA